MAPERGLLDDPPEAVVVGPELFAAALVAQGVPVRRVDWRPPEGAEALASLWRDEVEAKREQHWTIKKWDEYGAIFVATPGGVTPDEKHCLGANNATGAWFQFTWDASAFLRMHADLFFGDQRGMIMQAERTGYDDARILECLFVVGHYRLLAGVVNSLDFPVLNHGS